MNEIDNDGAQEPHQDVQDRECRNPTLGVVGG